MFVPSCLLAPSRYARLPARLFEDAFLPRFSSSALPATVAQGAAPARLRA